jgi:thiopeptide-type bacteriocin biosynthesis protein
MLRQQPASEADLGPIVANMVGIVSGFFGERSEAMAWLAAQPAPNASALERPAAERAIRAATDPTQIPGWESGVEGAWHQRAAALAVYRRTLPPETNVAVVLESLMHMHHNRAVGINPEIERTCRRLARQAARSEIARKEASAP